jgi:hypothetical protein
MAIIVAKIKFQWKICDSGAVAMPIKIRAGAATLKIKLIKKCGVSCGRILKWMHKNPVSIIKNMGMRMLTTISIADSS